MTADLTKPAPPRSRRRWLSYSLRTLLLVTAAVAVWLGVQVNRATNQRRAVSMVKERGGTVRYAHQSRTQPVRLTDFYSSSTFDPDAPPPGPDWLRQRLGEEYFQDVLYVSLADRVASEGDADANLIAALPKLEYLDMGFCDLTDEALRELGRIRTLRILRVDRNNDLSDDGLRHLAQCKSLESLNLNGIDGIRGPGLEHLSSLNSLKELDLQYVPLDCDWLKGLAVLPLEKLMLSKTPLEDAHLAHVGQITSLVILGIDRTKVTAAGFAHLTRLKSLQQLYVNETVALEGIEHLRELPSLNHLGVETKSPDNPDEAILQRLRQALPGCTVQAL
jgi:hypothetical protein